MNRNDVIVIGGGLTGIFAAITAARRGRQVLLVTKGVGAIAIAGGTIDILGYDGRGTPVGNPWEALPELDAGHPYSLLGRKDVAAAAQEFLALCEAEGYPYLGELHRNLWIPTALGKRKPTCFVPLSMDPTALGEAREVCVAGFEGLKDYSARVIADGLTRSFGGRKRLSTVVIRTGLPGGRDLTALDVARWLETEAGQSSCIGQLSSATDPDGVILMPPVLGTRPDYDVYRSLSEGARRHIVETVGLPPAVTGFRLRRMLINCLRKSKVRLIEQSSVIGAEVSQGRCHGIVTGNLDRERRYQAESFILASGGLFGGGLQTGPDRILESVFRLPVEAPKEQEKWSHETLFFTTGQPFAKFGVKTDSCLRPVDTSGRVLLENVFVAGRTLAGYDYCQEKSGNGVALATAYRAGCEA